MNCILVVLILFMSAHSQLAGLPRVTQVHITLGDYFVDKISNILYRVGFTLQTQELQIQLRVNPVNEKEFQFFPTKECREYFVKDDSDPKNKIDYRRFFCFIELKDLKNPKKFQYQFIYNEKLINQAFDFESNIIDSKSPIIVVFGDHDVIDVGLKTKAALEIYKYDLLVFCGDLAYDIQDENGKRGDDYFENMEKVFTQSPFILTPGNHENFDLTRMLTTRFWMPGTMSPMDNNLFSFQVHDIMFTTLNFDVPLNLFDQDFYTYVHKLDKLMTESEQKFNPKYKVFFSHRPFYCSQYDIWEYGCTQLPYVMKPFEDILNKHKTNLYFFGHVHGYERFSPMDSFLIQADKSKAFIITGTGGNHESFNEIVPFDIQFKKKHIYKTPGFSVMNPRNTKIKVDWVSVEGFVVMDEITLLYFDPQNGNIFGKWFYIFVFLFFSLIFLSILIGGKLWKDRKLQASISEEML